jgi:hypothetical protein
MPPTERISKPYSTKPWSYSDNIKKVSRDKALEMYHIKDTPGVIISLTIKREVVAMMIISWGLMAIAFVLLSYLWKEELREEEN